MSVQEEVREELEHVREMTKRLARMIYIFARQAGEVSKYLKEDAWRLEEVIRGGMDLRAINYRAEDIAAQCRELFDVLQEVYDRAVKLERESGFVLEGLEHGMGRRRQEIL